MSLTNARAVSALYLGISFFGVLALRYIWTVLQPGTLVISDEGISQELGWRKRRWSWREISGTEVVRTAANLVSVCLIYFPDDDKVRLYGWELSPEELQRKIEEHRGKQPLAHT